MKSLLSFFLFIGVSSFIFGQATKQGWNDYSKHPKLGWSDFKGKNPNLDPSLAAEITTSLEYRWAYETEETTIRFLYDVYALQDPKTSWVKDDKTKTKRVLDHEQLHFDITELHARMFRKWLSEFEYLTTRNLRRQLERKFTEVKLTWKQMQQAYDKETDKGTIPNEQLKWNKKIDSLSAVYIQFKS